MLRSSKEDGYIVRVRLMLPLNDMRMTTCVNAAPAQMMLRDAVHPGVLHGVGPEGDQQIPIYPGTRLGVDICGISK